MIFNNKSEFDKEFKALNKKYQSLENDFEDLKLFLESCPTGDILPQDHIVRISGLGEKIVGEFYKVRRFHCKSLKSKGDLRIVYCYKHEERTIEFHEIEFIEIFKKDNKKENHDIERIKKYYSE